jgi:hypothetical protein
MAITRTDLVYSGCPADINESTVATIAASTAFIIKGFVVSNADTSAHAVTLKIDSKRIVPGTEIPANDALVQDGLHIPVLATKTIKFTGGSANNMDYYIWGVQEVTS